MKLIVLIKEIVDTDSVDIEEDEYLPKNFDSDDIMMSQFDKHAIEAALQIKEKFEGTEVHALCLGSENALKVLRESIAMGVDSASRVQADDLEYLHPLAKGNILTKAIKNLGDFDLILTGMYSSDFSQAQLPVNLSTNLNLPHITYLDDITLENDDVVGRRYIEGGAITIKVSKPCVVSIASTANEPRYTSVKRILKAKKTEIPVLSLDDIDIDKTSLTGFGGLELIGVEEPEEDDLEVFKIEEDDIDIGVGKLLTKLKEDKIDLGAFK